MGHSVSRDDLDRYLSGFSCVSVLRALGVLSIGLFKDNKPFVEVKVESGGEPRDSFISQASLAYIAHRSLFASKLSGGTAVTVNDVAGASDLYLRMYDLMELRPVGAKLTERDLMQFFGRVSFDQLPWQDGAERDDLVRAWTILEKCQERERSGIRLDINAAMQAIHGLTLHQFMGAGLLLFGYLEKRGPVFVQRPFEEYLAKTGGGYLTPEHFVMMLEWIGRSLATLRIYDSREEVTPPGLEKYELNRLVKFPVVQENVGQGAVSWVIPNLPMLFRRLSSGMCWDLRDHYQAEANSDDFAISFGDAFADYCGDLLRSAFGDENVKDLRAGDGAVKGADWLAIHEDEGFIFECKTATLARSIRQSFDLDDVEAWSRKRIVKAVDQLRATIRNVGGMKKWRRLEAVILVYDDISFDEMPLLGKWLRDIVDKHLTERVRFHMMRVKELEQMEEPIRGGLLGSCLDWRQNFIFSSHYLVDGLKIPAPRLTACAHRLGSGLNQNTYLRQRWDAYFTRMYPWITRPAR